MTAAKTIELIRQATTPWARALIALAYLAETGEDGRAVLDALWQAGPGT